MDRLDMQKQRNERRVENAKKILKCGDRIRVSRCSGTNTTYTFSGWDGRWIVSKSGINDISVVSVFRLNGKDIDFLNP